ncbi:MAG: stage III sporulation protein AF [Clostridia bacterium]
MVEVFKIWISSMLCIGIFITFVQLIIPKTNLKKYIYSLIGIVTILTIVSPVIKLLKENSIEDGIKEVIANISIEENHINQNESTKYKEATKETIGQNMILSMKEDIKTKLEEQKVNVNNIDIALDENYNVENIDINIENINKKNTNIINVNSVINYINKEYGIKYSKISVTEEAKK